jgi:hypothetical protein
MLRSLPKVPRVFYMGGIDLEPAWSSPEAAGKWVQGYREAGSVPLLSNASADGCPYDASRRSCSNGWNIGMLAEMVWGGPGWAVIPQIYRHDGVMAEQWGQIAREWHARGKRPLFVGVMTQFRACQQVRNSNCPQLSLAPEKAVEQMRRALGELARVPSVTDVGWG